MQGRSLTPLLKGNTPDDWRKSFYYHYYENPGAHNVARHYGVTDGDYKLIHLYALEGQKLDDWELYDLKQDPEELRSVYGDTKYAAVQLRLVGELDRLRKLYKVTPDDDPGRPRRKRNNR